MIGGVTMKRIMMNKNKMSINNINKTNKTKTQKDIMKVLMTSAMFLIFILFLSNQTFAIRASLGNSRMILRVNVSKGHPGVLSGFITVNNYNPYPVQVMVLPDQVLSSLDTQVKPQAFTLQPNESKDVSFKVTVYEPGRYDGKLLVSYRGRPLNSSRDEQVGLSATIIIFAHGESSGLKPKQNNKNPSQDSNQANQGSNTQTQPNQPQQGQSQSNIVSEPSKIKPNTIVGLIITIVIVVIGLLLFKLLQKRTR